MQTVSSQLLSSVRTVPLNFLKIRARLVQFTPQLKLLRFIKTEIFCWNKFLRLEPTLFSFKVSIIDVTSFKEEFLINFCQILFNNIFVSPNWILSVPYLGNNIWHVCLISQLRVFKYNILIKNFNSCGSNWFRTEL